MNTALKKIATNIVLSFLVSITLLSPNYIFRLFNDAYTIQFRQAEYFWIFFLFGFILVSSKSYKLVLFVFILLGLIEITQFCNYAYFNDYIDPYAIGLMFEEIAEITLVAGNSTFSLLYAPLVVIVPYFLTFLIIRKFWKNQFKIKFFSFLLILFLIFPALRIPSQNDILRLFPYKKLPSLANSLNSYSAYFFYFLPKKFIKTEARKFAPYTVVKMRDISDATIIIVVGESFTFSRMSLFGFEKKTTPHLDELKKDNNFIYKEGLSASTATRSTMPLLFNIQYNPLNEDVIKNQKTNMFRLAKEAGFKTFFISAQSSNCLTGIGTKFIDKFISFDTEKDIFEKNKDEGLLILAKKMNMGRKNLIVLHQRNIHDPFEKNYSHRKEFLKFPIDDVSYIQKRKNGYDNGVLYNDFLFNEIINYYKKRIEKNLYIFITSDHGEVFGENGHYGHTKLIRGCFSVPFLFYSANTDGKIEKKIRDIFYPTHYETGEFIAECMGYRIGNPNIEKDIVYINGSAAFGNNGYAKIKKLVKEKELEIEIIGVK